MSGLAFTAISILLVRFTIVVINIFHRQWLKAGNPDGEPLVSVLIPARNEERALQLILGDLVDHDYTRLEILVYDDLSEDRTAAVVKDYAACDRRIRLIGGKALPDGWTGKNHACHRLAEEARGAYLLFLDADVRVREGLVRNSLGHLQQHGLKLLSIFPRQLMLTLGEKLVVPAMNLILLSLLPMQLIRVSHRPSLAAANGQFMLFEAENYHRHQYHKAVREKHVEDMQIIRLMKQQRLRVHTLLSSGEVDCRMYSSFWEAVGGLTRSVFAFFGNSMIVLLLFTVFSTFGFLFTGLGLGWFWVVPYLVLTWLMRMLTAFASRQHLGWTAILQPLQQAAFVIVVIESFRRRFSERNIWKGREIKFS